MSGNIQIEPNSSSTNGIARPGVVDVAPERDVLGLPVLRRDRDAKMIGTSAAAPSPRYVRFWKRSLTSSQR